MTTLDTRPRAPGLRPLSLGCTTGRTPDLKMATAPTPTSCDSAWSCPGHASAGRPRYLGTLQDRRQTGHYGQDRPGRGARLRRSLRPARPLGWRRGRVYFLTLLVPSRDDRTPALTAR